MSRTASALRLLLGGSLLGSVMLLGHASAATATTAKFYLRQEGCGTTAEPGRLEPKAGADGADGCGTIGGLPLDEALAQADGPLFEDYDTGKAGIPVKLDSARKVTGQVAAGSWYGVGGAGQVTFDLVLTARTTAGKSIDFGTKTVSGTITPTASVITIPFEFAVPASGKGATLSHITLSVAQRGANVGYSAKALSGQAFIVFPTRLK